jgi:hypothetical protein
LIVDPDPPVGCHHEYLLAFPNNNRGHDTLALLRGRHYSCVNEYPLARLKPGAPLLRRHPRRELARVFL